MTEEEPLITARDRRHDSRVLLTVCGALLVAFCVGAFVFRFERNEPSLFGPALDIGVRLFANLTAVAIALIGAAALRLQERRALARIAGVLTIAACASLLRFVLQLLVHIYEAPTWDIFVTEVSSVFLIGSTALLLGLSQADALARLRRQERSSAHQALRAAAALEALSSEELRARREVAERLHGTVQHRLVLLGSQLSSIIDRQEPSTDAATDDLSEIVLLQQDIDGIRQRDLREMSRLLYSPGMELGIAHAIRLLMRRIPPTIATDVVIDAELAGGDRIGVDRRALLVRAAEEAITNALKHGGAGQLSLSLALESGALRLAIEDNGAGLAPGALTWNGLARLADRARAFGGTVSLDAAQSRGAILSVMVPLQPRG